MKLKDVLVFIIAIAVITLGAFALVNLLDKDSDNSFFGGNKEPEEEEVYIPVYLTTTEALEIANDLYSKAEIITYDPLSYSEYKFDASDRVGYTNKITNYTYITSKIFKDTSKAIIKEHELDSETGILYINNALTDKNKYYLKTELQLRENDEDRIAFNAVSSYCSKDDKVCKEEDKIENTYTRTQSFIIVKEGGVWKVESFTIQP